MHVDLHEIDVKQVDLDLSKIETIAELKVRLGTILQQAPSALDISESAHGEPLPDWAQPPFECVATRRSPKGAAYFVLAVRIPDKNAQVILHACVSLGQTREVVRMTTARVLDTLPHFVELYT